MLTGAPLCAVLFDVGGTLVDETGDYVFSLQVVKDVLTRELGREVSEEEIESARDRAISAWAPSFTKAVLWHFLSPDIERTKAVYEEVVSRIFAHREEVTLMEGVKEVIPKLARRYKLAVAGNQPLEMIEKLKKTGVLEHFTAVVLSSEIRFHKPDSRFFLEVCERISVLPENCCMVGDRLDNDIYPANVLGMRTIWVRTGPHAVQRPRVPEDVPDAIVGSMREVLEVIEGWERKSSMVEGS